MLLKRKVDIETAKADIEGVNSLHKTAQNKSADRYITKSDSRFLGVFGEKTVNVMKVNLMLDGIL
ncbi:MAG: potassium-transporting ATPase subunit C [Lachnobacterium sp.]|nr:potassium-transporting ATPase subunit C [Lachnobacterium sp.]